MPFTVYGRVRTVTVLFAAMCTNPHIGRALCYRVRTVTVFFAAMCTNPRIGRALCYRVRTVTVMAKRFPLRPLRA